MGRLAASKTGDLSNPPAERERFDSALVAACGDGKPTAAGEAAFLRKPYLNYQPGGTALVWTSASSKLETVYLFDERGGKVATLTPVIDESAPVPGGVQKVVYIRNLVEPGIYCYQIKGDAGTLQTRTGFRAPQVGDDVTVRFAAMGDLGLASQDQKAVFSTLQEFETDFVLVPGDVAYEDGKLSQLERNFFGVYGPMLKNVPFIPAAGNHDYETGHGAPLRQAFVLPTNGGPYAKERWFSFDWGPAHFVVLDSQAALDEQQDWLRRDLRNAKPPWRIVVLHKPLYSAGHHGGSGYLRRKFERVLSAAHVQLVIAGHDHDYERSLPVKGIVHIVTGGGGRGTRAVGRTGHTAFSEQVAHFTYVTVDKTTLRLHAIDAKGNEFDSLVLTQQPESRAP